jgi:hypothetical protein
MTMQIDGSGKKGVYFSRLVKQAIRGVNTTDRAPERVIMLMRIALALDATVVIGRD